MTNEETLEGNKLISCFMGQEWKQNIPHAPILNSQDNPVQYHIDWNWLIPVCKKCADISMNQPDRPTVNHCSKLDWLESEIGTYMRDYEIDKVYLAVIEFIKCYNSKQEKFA